MSGVDVLREAKRDRSGDHQHRHDRVRLDRHGRRGAAPRRRRLRRTSRRARTTTAAAGAQGARAQAAAAGERAAQARAPDRRTSSRTSSAAATPMLAVFQLIETIAPTSSTVLITGESGTGKELVARAIHFNSLRKDRPFVALNCGALSGDAARVRALRPHARRVHRRRHATRRACIEVAEKGTIFLDEIGEMSAARAGQAAARAAGAQVPARSAAPKRSRPTSASSRPPTATCRRWSPTGGSARTCSTASTSSRSRCRRCASGVEDIPLLAEHFLAKFATQMGKPITGISARRHGSCSQAYDWPGNIRELENAIERAVALERTPSILPESLPEQVRGARRAARRGRAVGRASPTAGFDLEQHVQHIEREYIAEGARARRRGQGQGRRAARDELPVVPVLHEEIQPEVGRPTLSDNRGRHKLSVRQKVAPIRSSPAVVWFSLTEDYDLSAH